MNDNRVRIVGIAEVPQGEIALPSTMALHDRLARLALDDAGLMLSDVDAVLTVSPRSDPYLIHAGALAEHLAITPSMALTVEAGGAAPMTMIEIARGLINSGTARAVLVVAADMPLGGVTRDAYVNALTEAGPVHPDLERPYGPSVPAMFALVATAHAKRYGTTSAHLGAVAVQEREAASKHPNAHQRQPLSMDAYLESRLIADPLRLLDCAPVSDGGGALVITSQERATGLPGRHVAVSSTGFSMGHMHLSSASSLTEFSAGRAMQQALKAARRSLADLDVSLVYDCFSIAMLVNLEDLGFVAKGEAGPAFAAGHFSSSGACPVNPHGGLLSHGHPARAGGMGNVVEAVVQLRGAAGTRQIANAQRAMAHGMGGAFGTHGVVILEQT